MKRLGLTALAIAAALAGAGCQHKAEPLTVAEFNVYSSYEGKLSGKYLLYVDTSNLKKPVKPDDINCSAWTFPLALDAGFSGSVRKTLSNLVNELEVVDAPVDRDGLKAQGAKGMIIVRGEDVQARLRVVPGFWSAGIETEMEISASITVDGPHGRLLGTTVSGDGNNQSDAGAFCAGGAKSLVASAEPAMKEVVGRLGEALVNSERVRTGT